MRLTAREIAAAAGSITAGDPDAVADSFAIDSRVLESGACFAALVGERDGHDFVPDAFRRGATIALVSAPVALPPGSRSRAVVRVQDPATALAALGRLARRRLPSTVVVGITGSAGKTATKDLLASALARRWRVAASPASFNNEVGLPLTLLGADPATEVLVAEMGARFAGNIADLCEIARPRVGVVTNIGSAHAGPLGGRAGILAVKGELLEALPPEGFAVLNGEEEEDATAALAARTRARVVRVGREQCQDADVRATGVSLDDELRPAFHVETATVSFPVQLRVRGEHQVLNAAMAAAVALELGVPAGEVATGLAAAGGARWRMQLVRAPGHFTVLNDAYNASPQTVAAAIRALGRLQARGRRMAVLGEMRELGRESEAAHTTVGRLAAEGGVDVLVVVGDAGRAIARGARAAGVDEVVEVADAAAAGDEIATRIGSGDVVLLKASRAVGLEHVAEALAGLEVAS